MRKIGFIGLGHMGGPMAANLVKAGHHLTVYDVVPVSLANVKIAANLAELIKDVDYVISMLPAGSHVREVYLGADGLLAHADRSITFMECSTIDVQTAKAIHEAVAKKGGVCVDAPVSGGTASAAAGTLTFMVGGTDQAFQQVKPILEAMGKKIFHAGLAGCGQMAKICNNLLLGISMIGVCEAFNLGKALGLEPQAFFDICKEASGQCWSLTQYCPVPGILPNTPANRDYEPGFMAKMMLKDLNLAEDAAHTVAALTPLGEKARDLYQAFCDAGYQDKDFSGIIGWLKKQSFI